MKRLFCCRRHYSTSHAAALQPSNLRRPILLLNSGDHHRHPILYASALQACVASRSASHGLQIHSHVVKSGLDADRFVGNSLLSFYFKLCPNFSLTRRLFDGLPTKDVISWTSIVSGYVRSGDPIQSLHVFQEMVKLGGVEPNEFTLSATVKACSDLGNPRLGSCFHGIVLARGHASNRVIASALVDMYGKNLILDEARQAFDEMLDPDSVCYTSMISAFARKDCFTDALQLFHTMMRKRIAASPDGYTFGIVFTVLGNLGNLRQGREAHGKVITCGLTGNVVVESSVVDMYAKCGLTKESRSVFDRMKAKNEVSWCALLNGYCQSGDHETVLNLFHQMKTGNDRYSFGTVLKACAGLTAVRQGKEVHCRYLRIGGWKDVVVESALIDLYAKCGLVDFASSVFDHFSEKNLIVWNAMICGLAQNGRGARAVELFDRMLREGMRPDYISFVGVLFACSHTGLVEQGRKYFRSMSDDYGIKHGVEHYNCMVDLFSRVGQLEEAEDLIRGSDFKDDSTLWTALLGACSTYSDPTVAERVAKKMMELEPGYHLSYVLLANVYKTVGRWNDALEIRRLMRERGARKEVGKSWIEIKGTIRRLIPQASSKYLKRFGT